MPGAMKFQDLVNFFERITKGKDALGRPLRETGKLKEVQNLMDYFLEKEGVTSLYPLVRLLCPELDKKGHTYFLKEKALANLLIQGMGITEKSDDAQKLLGYQVTQAEGQGNFSNVLWNILKTPGRCAAGDQGTKTIREVNEFLENLANNKDKGRQTELFKKNMCNYTKTEWKYLVRIILRDMKVGVNEKWTLKALHPDAAEFFGHNNNDIKKVCNTLTDRSKRKSCNMNLFQPFVPMMCEKPHDSNSVAKMFANKVFYIEKKMDGERLQIHKDGDKFMLFTRKGNDYSNLYKWITDQIIQKNLIKADKCILDGEIVGWYPGPERKEGQPEPTGGQPAQFLPPTSLKTIAIMLGGGFKGTNESGPVGKGDISEIDGKENQERCRLCLSIFDILQLENDSLQMLPLQERLEKMKEVCTWAPKLFERTVMKTASSLEDANRAIYDMGEKDEGIVMKLPNSTYKVGGRNGTGWMKLKPDYLSGANESFDIAIIGGNYGNGWRSGKIMQYTVGVVERDKKSGQLTRFRSFARVGTGLDRNTHTELAQKFDSIKVNVPKGLQGEVTGEDGTKATFRRNTDMSYEVTFDSGVTCFFILNPKEEVQVVCDPLKLNTVVEVIADRRMIPTNLYHAGRCFPGCPVPLDDTNTPGMGWSLRFPRIGPQGIRQISAKDAMDTEELWKAIVRSFSGNNMAKTDGSLQLKGKKGQKDRKRATAKATKVGGATDAFTDDIPVVSDCLSGCEVCVLDTTAPKKSERDKAITCARSLGAVATASVGPRTTTHIVSLGNVDAIFEAQIAAGRDIIKADWLFECEKEDQMVALEPRFMWHTSRATEEAFRDLFDRFGDNFTKPISDKAAEAVLDRGKSERGDVDIGDLDRNVEDMEIQLAVASVTEGKEVQAYIAPRGDEHGREWVNCVVLEYLVDTNEFVVCCLDRSCVQARHVVRADYVNELSDAFVPEWSVFRGVRALFVEYAEDGQLRVPRNRLAKLNLLAGGGVSVDAPREATHVVVDLGFGGTTRWLAQELGRRGVSLGEGGPCVVDVSWVLDSIRECERKEIDEGYQRYDKVPALLDEVTGAEVKTRGRAESDQSEGPPAKKQRTAGGL
eukprot:CAMPEP_0173429060 /NCGR_PEP_ID=MMETSP1357-20121228/7875_1 /TAXON_ID=77926 /ORGANISM="Hemiselmis rufescens, Strain PCC563" /LENGTH=1097 /DNA_ID=CAMNT_0014393181 /DNA_START=1 /DNA_END=3294 /DNA_ORIENTATION=+